MTSDEHEYIEHLEALVKRYRKRIIELKAALRLFTPPTLGGLGGLTAEELARPDPDRKTP